MARTHDVSPNTASHTDGWAAFFREHQEALDGYPVRALIDDATSQPGAACALARITVLGWLAALDASVASFLDRPIAVLARQKQALQATQGALQALLAQLPVQSPVPSPQDEAAPDDHTAAPPHHRWASALHHRRAPRFAARGNRTGQHRA